MEKWRDYLGGIQIKESESQLNSELRKNHSFTQMLRIRMLILIKRGQFTTR